MKKIVSIILSIVLTLSLGITALAESKTLTSDNNSTDIKVTGTYTASSEKVKISVNVSWDEMSFDYTAGETGEWDPTSHKYGASADGEWEADTKTITVTNHSNVKIKATLDFNTSVDGLAGTFTENSETANDNILIIATADEGESLGDADKAPYASAEFGISGTAISAETDLGLITVSIENAESN